MPLNERVWNIERHKSTYHYNDMQKHSITQSTTCITHACMHGHTHMHILTQKHTHMHAHTNTHAHMHTSTHALAHTHPHSVFITGKSIEQRRDIVFKQTE